MAGQPALDFDKDAKAKLGPLEPAEGVLGEGNLYGLAELPNETAAQEIGAKWRPYATAASWYCWRSLELKQNGKATPTKK